MAFRPAILLSALAVCFTLSLATSSVESMRQMKMPLPTKGPLPTLRPRVSRTPCPLTPQQMRRVVNLRKKLFRIRKRTPCVKTVCNLQRRLDRARKCVYTGKSKEVYKALVAKCSMRKSVVQQILEQKKYCTIGPMDKCDKPLLTRLYKQRRGIVKACIKLGWHRRSGSGTGSGSCPSVKDARRALFQAKKSCRRSASADFEEFFNIKDRLLRIKRCRARPSSAPRRKW